MRWNDADRTWYAVGSAQARALLVDPHLDVVPSSWPARTIRDDEVPTAEEFLSSWFSRAPAPAHRRIKRLVSRAYGASVVAAGEADFRSVAAAIASRLPDSIDLVAEFLQPYWFQTTFDMVGLPAGDDASTAKAVLVLGAVLELARLNDVSRAALQQATRTLRRLTDELVTTSRTPIAAVLREVTEAEHGGIWAATAVLSQVLVAGFVPTLTAAALCWEQVCAALRDGAAAADIDLDAVLERTLLEHPPFPFLHRWVRRRCECHGVILPEGAHVVVDLRAVHREGGTSLAFGHGSHRCLGASLAKHHIRAALVNLLALDPVRRPVPVGSPRLHAGHVLRVVSMPCKARDASPLR